MRKYGILGAIAMLGAVLMTANVASADGGPVKICTGGSSGNYYKVGGMVSGQADKGAIEVVETRGSWENLEKLASGECDAAIVQSDAPDVFKKQTKSTVALQRVTSLYNEYVHLVCNTSSGIESVGDLSDKNTVIIGQDGSGSYVTWSNFVAEDSGYENVQTTPGMGDDVDFLTLQDGVDAQCMLFVTGKGSAKITNLAASSDGKLRLVDVNDSDFNDTETADGDDVYTWASLDNYQGFEHRWTSVDTIALRAVLYVNKNFVKDNPQSFAKFATAVKKATPSIRAELGAVE